MAIRTSIRRSMNPDGRGIPERAVAGPLGETAQVKLSGGRILFIAGGFAHRAGLAREYWRGDDFTTATCFSFTINSRLD